MSAVLRLFYSDIKTLKSPFATLSHALIFPLIVGFVFPFIMNGYPVDWGVLGPTIFCIVLLFCTFMLANNIIDPLIQTGFAERYLTHYQKCWPLILEKSIFMWLMTLSVAYFLTLPFAIFFEYTPQTVLQTLIMMPVFCFNISLLCLGIRFLSFHAHHSSLPIILALPLALPSLIFMVGGDAEQPLSSTFGLLLSQTFLLIPAMLAVSCYSLRNS
jgi:ABC-type transport system involved in cytochrome c biogenesis permease component